MHRHARGVHVRTDIDPPVSVPATPVVRARAEELGISLDMVSGSGVDGRVRLGDLAPPDTPSETGSEGHALPMGSGSSGSGAVVVEVDVAPWAVGGEPDPRAHVVSTLLEAASGRVTGAAVAITDSTGALRSVEVPQATELSVAGLARAIATAEHQELSTPLAPAPPAATRGPVLTVVRAMAGVAVEIPVVMPASAVTVTVRAPELRVVPTSADGDHAIAVREIAPVTIAWNPAVVTRALIADMVTALRSARR